MAKLITKKYQNKNEKNNGYEKWYARIVHTETLTTEQFAKHIRDHGSPFDRATILGVLMTACDCLVELVMDSKKVRLGDLGTFYCSSETDGSETAKGFTDNNVKKVHLRFLPNKTNDYALDSTSLRNSASFVDYDNLQASSTSKAKQTNQEEQNNQEKQDE